MSRNVACGITFILGVGVGWLVQGSHWEVFFSSYVPALATLLAAFYGAKYAFQFQNDKEKEDIKRRNVVNGNISIFSMMRMVSDLRNIQQQIIDPVRKNAFRFIEMRPILYKEDGINLNIESLHFLLETDYRNLLGEIATEVARYQSALKVINERSRVHRQEIQPALERAGIVEGGSDSDQQIRTALGDLLYFSISRSTDEVIEHVDKTIKSLKCTADKLRESLQKQFPDEKIIGFDITT